MSSSVIILITLLSPTSSRCISLNFSYSCYCIITLEKCLCLHWASLQLEVQDSILQRHIIYIALSCTRNGKTASPQKLDRGLQIRSEKFGFSDTKISITI